jgi:uncharacterized cupin superfamily protein
MHAGPSGAHQVSNRTTETVRVVIVGNWAIPRAVFYPDSNEIKVRWSPTDEGQAMWQLGETTGYWDSEGPGAQ